MNELNPIKLRGHHIGALIEYKKNPRLFMRNIISQYGLDTAKRINNIMKNITLDTDVVIVKGLDDVCRRCVYNINCVNEDWHGLKLGFINQSLKYGGKYFEEAYSYNYNRKDVFTEIDDYTCLKEMSLEVGEIYKWGELVQRNIDMENTVIRRNLKIDDPILVKYLASQ